MRIVHSRRFLKSLLIGALAIGALVGLASSRTTVRASTPAAYTVLAGLDTPYGVSAIAFGPQTLKVHRGDTVTWRFLGFHNVRFDQKPAEMIVMSQIDGKTMPEFNPVIAFPSAKSGDVYKTGAGSGIPLPAPGQAPGEVTFSVVMDVEPGTYVYVCDVHPGMIGYIVVVDDKTEIPSPAEVEKLGKADLDAAIAAGEHAYLDLLRRFPPVPQGDALQISAGGQEGLAAIIRFFPEDATIQAGQSVTWTVPRGFEIHTVNIPLPKEGRPPELQFIMDSKQVPHVIPTDVLAPNAQSGAEVPADGNVKSGILASGQTFTLKFPKAGVYSYFCAIHPNQFGTIVVLPGEQK